MQNRTPDPTSPPPSVGAAAFLFLVFGSTWLFQLPWLLARRGILNGPPERFMPLVVVGFFGPLLIALTLATIHGEGPRLLRSLWSPRVAPGWYAFALLLPCALFVLARAVLAPVASGLGPFFYPPVQAQQLAAMCLIPLTEQLPWRGYLYPRLERAHGPRCASLWTGLAWALFHVQKHAFFDPNASLVQAVVTVVYMTAGTFAFTWLYLRTRRSLLVVVVANMGLYLNNPTQALPSLTPTIIHAFGFCILAFALLTLDRKAWASSTWPDAELLQRVS